MNSKWIIRDMPGYRFAEDGTLWRLPFESSGKSYAAREIKMQYPNRWRIGDKVWSKRQLRAKLEIDPAPVVLVKEFEMPF
jgi:hypothetical protein